MIAIFDERQLAHAPARELNNGEWVDYWERPERARNILERLGPAAKARDWGMAPIAAVHDADYLRFLQNAHAEWRAARRNGDAIGYAFPVVRRRPLALDRIDAKIGAFSFDAATPIAADTWPSAYWSAQTALTALAALGEDGANLSFALCRPPGHHAGADYMGGYCYLNNAAIAAQAAASAGERVAILDIDYHHGNGTQDVFYERGDVFFASIHADPSTDYPYFWGHRDECGAGQGEGATLNLPLARGADLGSYQEALERALAAIGGWGASLLVVSFGADTFEGDPISGFALGIDDYPIVAAQIANPSRPTLVVMEGGYAVDRLGEITAAFLAGF